MITRRALLRAAALGAASLAFPLRLSLRAGAAPRPRFFSRAERRALEALCDRILPPDRDPGAKALGAARYVERLLTAFDVDPPGIYAGGPFSGRAPFANRRGRGGPAFPENGFSEPLALTRLQELAWRTEIFGSEAAGLPSALAAQRSGPIEGLRDVYREGLAALDALARERGAAPFPALSKAEQDDLVAQLDGPESIEFPGRGESFLDVVIRHVLEGCFAAPEYGGNRQLAGWRMIGIEGDSQPLGFSVFSSARGAYRERPRHPMSTPNPDDLAPGGSLSAAPALGRRHRAAGRDRRLRRLPREPRSGSLRIAWPGPTTRCSATVPSSASTPASSEAAPAAAARPACWPRPAGTCSCSRRATTRFPGSTAPARSLAPHHSSDELKYKVRGWLGPEGLLEPRTFRTDPGAEATLRGDVNHLPKAVGGAFQHADCKTPRFNAVDFRLRSEVEALLGATPGLAVPGFGADPAGASFADWPFGYDDLEPCYVEAEALYGVQGAADDPFASPRSAPYPMPPGVPMYLGLLLADAAERTAFAGGSLHPHRYPAAINSQPYAGRPACVDCGFCAGFGCPSHAKGSPAVTALRRAFQTGRCQLRYNCQVAPPRERRRTRERRAVPGRRRRRAEAPSPIASSWRRARSSRPASACSRRRRRAAPSATAAGSSAETSSSTTRRW